MLQKKLKYPAVISIGGWNDSHGTIRQPGKFAATLQNVSAPGIPGLIQVNKDIGPFTEDRNQCNINFANQFAFELWQCGRLRFTSKTIVLRGLLIFGWNLLVSMY
jgi:prolyl oligopeptidase